MTRTCSRTALQFDGPLSLPYPQLREQAEAKKRDLEKLVSALERVASDEALQGVASEGGDSSAGVATSSEKNELAQAVATCRHEFGQAKVRSLASS